MKRGREVLKQKGNNERSIVYAPMQGWRKNRFRKKGKKGKIGKRTGGERIRKDRRNKGRRKREEERDE
jgi:hypothetical protein